MSFDDLQKAWNDQDRGGSAGRPDPLIPKVQAADRRFWGLLAVAAIRDAACLVFFVWTIVAAIEGREVPAPVVLAVVAIFVLGMAILLAGSRFLGRDLLGGGLVRERVGRDASRFVWLVRWRNAREVIGCSIVMFIFALNALKRGDYLGIRCASIACLGLAAGLYLVRSLRIELRKPAAGATLLGDLDTALYFTRAQMGLLGNLWWYLVPAFAAAILDSLPLVFEGHERMSHLLGSLPGGAMIYFVVWAVNRWIVRSRLAPRAEHLKRIQAEFLRISPDSTASLQ